MQSTYFAITFSFIFVKKIESTNNFKNYTISKKFVHHKIGFYQSNTFALRCLNIILVVLAKFYFIYKKTLLTIRQIRYNFTDTPNLQT